ncbi:Ribonuclease HII [hydrothermal vent metagenome]|uniref:Ribonuclease HII n=1 Tax=hydrothermal vent metagenome TaxID=652676 RepID=A0A3B0VSV3_9ZZZZ
MLIAGVDEAGRGPLAGPVTVAAVILKNPAAGLLVAGLNDSKKLTEKKRIELEPIIIANSLAYAIVHISVEKIEEINILQASLYGMQQAVAQLSITADEIMVDGNKCPEFSQPARAIIGGDGKIAAISAASILAKNARDRLMVELSVQFSQYGFEKHKGYGTKYHLQQLQKYGPCKHHRISYAPVQKVLLSLSSIGVKL